MNEILFLNNNSLALHQNYKFKYDYRPRKKDCAKFYHCSEYYFCEIKCHATLKIIPNGTIERKHEHNHEPMLPIEAEYFVALEKLKRQTSADPTIDINEVKRSYQGLRDDLDAKHGREMVAPHWRSWRDVKSMFYAKLRKKNGTAEPATTAHKIKLEPRHSTSNPFVRKHDATTSPYQILMSDQANEKDSYTQQKEQDEDFQLGLQVSQINFKEVPEDDQTNHFKQYFCELTNLMTFKKTEQLTELEGDDADDVADIDIIVSNEVFKFTNPYKKNQIAARINFKNHTITPQSVSIKLQVPDSQVSVAHPLKRKLILKQSPKAKRPKKIIKNENENDVIETAYYSTADNFFHGFDYDSTENFRQLLFYPTRPPVELDDIQISAAQDKIRSIFDYLPNSFGLYSPTYFQSHAHFLWDPRMTRKQQFIQVLHVPGHWLTITNSLKDTIVPGHWYVYDSLNDARYIPQLKTALQKLDNDMSSVIVHHVVVPSQLGVVDCGLFALAYAFTLCEGSNPARLQFHQNRMRNHYNLLLTSSAVANFPHDVILTDGDDLMTTHHLSLC